LADLLGIPADKVNEQRLYRALDMLLPHKEALEVFLKNRLGELFGLEYDLLLYDVTSTYFEGLAAANPLARRGYSRDHRPDCKQVCIGLVVTKGGMPLGYEVFAGNRVDVTTLQEIVETMERRYGRADRIWVSDRGMMSADNIAFLKQGGRRYIIGTPKSMLRQFERELLAKDWHTIRDGLEVKLCPTPDGDETFVLCRSRDRREKEKAMHDRFEQRIEEGLQRIASSCHRQRLEPLVVAQRVGRLLGQNSRAAGLFHTEVKTSPDGRATLQWTKTERWRDWAALSEGCYLLRSNVTDWSDEDLWKAYIQLTEAEAAFRVHRATCGCVRSGIKKKIACWRTSSSASWPTFFGRRLPSVANAPGLGHEPRRVFDELGKISWSMWSCPPAREPRSAAAASPSLQTIKPSCSPT